MADTTDLQLFQTVIDYLRRKAEEESVTSEDTLAFERFQERYTPRIRRICRREGLNAIDTEDAIQEIWAKIQDALPQFDHDRQKGRFRSWLNVTSTRHVITMRRKASRRRKHETLQPPRELDQHASENASVIDRLNEQEHEDRVKATIQRMEHSVKPGTRRFGELLRKFHFEHRTWADLAEEYGKSIEAIKKDVSRALKDFMKIFGQADDEMNRED